jgi:hypothetical protein
MREKVAIAQFSVPEKIDESFSKLEEIAEKA